jgi:hypothetical protein
MSVLTYACRIEVAPGVTVNAENITPLDLARARALEARRERLRQDLAGLIADAIHYDMPLTPELREAVAEWTADILDGERLRDQLREQLLQPA